MKTQISMLSERLQSLVLDDKFSGTLFFRMGQEMLGESVKCWKTLGYALGEST